MITIERTPKQLEFTGNPIAFNIVSDEYISSAGSKATCVITITGNLINTQYIVISFLDYSLTFTVGGDPNSGLYLPFGSPTCQQVVDCFNANYILTRYFQIYIKDLNEFYIKALNVGSLYNLTVDVTHIPPFSKVLTNGADQTFEPNFKFFVQLFYRTKYLIFWKSMPEQFYDPSINGSSAIYLNQQLKTVFNKKLIENLLPDFNTKFLTESRETIFHYFIQFAEVYGSTPEVKVLNSSDVFQVLNGKLPFDQYPGHDTLIDLQNTGKFLTNQSKPVETYKSAQQYLYWMNCEGRTIPQIGLMVKMYRNSNPSNPFTMVRDWIRNVAPLDVIIAPAGHDQLYAGIMSEVFKYEVFIYELFDEAPPVQLTEAVPFKMIPQKQYSKQLLFRNDFGVYQTLIVEKVQHKFEFETEIYQRDLEYDYQLPEGELTVKTENFHHKFTVRTGTMTKASADHLCELFANNEVYLIGKLQFIPIIIEKGTVELSDEADEIFTVKFDYRYNINGTLSPTA